MGAPPARRERALSIASAGGGRVALRRAALCSLLGAAGLLVPLPPNPEWQWLFNAAHVPLLAVLALLWLAALRQLGLNRRRAIVLVTVGGALAGGLLELAQFWIPARWPDVQDFLFNLLGLALGATLHHWLDRQRAR